MKKACNLDKGSTEPGRTTVAKIKRSQLREIAELKMNDLNAASIEAAERIIAGTARACGIEVAD